MALRPPPPAGHLLAQPRSRVPIPGTIDVSTTSAHDFDVDATTGFMPSQPPLSQLPDRYHQWEALLQDAIESRLRPVDHTRFDDSDKANSAEWRKRMEEIGVIDTEPLYHSETLLRRAHHVLSFLLSFYAHTSPRPSPNALPSSLPIPVSISVPLSLVSRQIGIAPVATYADTVLWNWGMASNTTPFPFQHAPSTSVTGLTALPSLKLSDLCCLSLFTSSRSESHFYLTAAAIELRSVEALSLMQSCLDELFVSDAIAVRRITTHLTRLGAVIDDLTGILDAVRDGCDPKEFYEDLRPWFRGGESWPGGQGWEFQGVDAESKERARFSAGASAGQSTIIHALDIFLGTPNVETPYLHQMEYHMPRHHRAFLRHLRSSPPQSTLRALVASPVATEAVKTAYNESVLALKRFRDTHIRIATLYIVSQARKAQQPAETAPPSTGSEGEKVMGTGGTDLVPFLKGIRDNTKLSLIQSDGPAGS